MIFLSLHLLLISSLLRNLYVYIRNVVHRRRVIFLCWQIITTRLDCHQFGLPRACTTTSLDYYDLRLFLFYTGGLYSYLCLILPPWNHRKRAVPFIKQRLISRTLIPFVMLVEEIITIFPFFSASS